MSTAPRDPHAVRVPPRPGLSAPARPKTVAVIGGGIAGLAAATALAERGVDVTLCESSNRLGGRVAAWPLDDGRTMSRGFHAFFRQYYNLRALLRRADPDLSRLVPIADYPLQRADGLVDSFATIPRTPPWNLAGFVLRSPSFPLRALAGIDLRTALELIDVDFPSTHSRYDGVSAAQFLDRLRFPRGARHLALEVFARSFFAHPEDFAAGELVAMFHTYFVGSSEGLLFDVPADDYDTTLWSPLGEHLAHLGATIRTSTRVTSLTQGPSGWRVASENGETDADAVVLAADPRSTRDLVARLEDTPGASASRAEAARAWRADIAQQRNAPPFAVLRLWLDGHVDPSRPAFRGTSGYALLDNVTVLEGYEDGARRWSGQHDGSVVELHAYALDAERDRHLATPGRIRELLLADMTAVYPETGDLGIVAEQLRIDDDCGLVDLEPRSRQPGVTTPFAGLVLAGDRIVCDYPVALMERAATTGLLAANELLSDWGVAGHEVISPPMRGLLRRGALGQLRPAVRREGAET